jgi:hypothetical protein
VKDMKNKFKFYLKLFSICAVCGAIFILSGYFYLNHKLEPAEIKNPSIPYTQSAPESKGIMFDICGDRSLAFINFEAGTLNIAFDVGETKKGDKLYGYTVDYTIESDYELLAYIIDIAGGIDLTFNDETLRYTGVQVTDILTHTADRKDLRRQVITAILKKIKNTGFQKEDFLYIIENSKTNLTIPDCYYWSDYIKTICNNMQIIN